MKTLTTEQKETLKEIPGYVRKEMLGRWIAYYARMFPTSGTAWENGFRDAVFQLHEDIADGVLNNDKDMREV